MVLDTVPAMTDGDHVVNDTIPADIEAPSYEDIASENNLNRILNQYSSQQESAAPSQVNLGDSQILRSQMHSFSASQREQYE